MGVDENRPRKGEADALKDIKEVNPKAKNLAEALDRADKALADVRDAADAPKLSEALSKPLANVPAPLDDVGAAAADILAARPEEILTAAGRTQNILGDVRLTHLSRWPENFSRKLCIIRG